MQLSIDPAVFPLLPGLRVGVLRVQGCDNTREDCLATSLRQAEAALRASLSVERFKEHPHIAAWQAAHRAFGSNPNKFPPSVQALTHRVLKGGELPNINPLVNAYNLASVTHVFPFGAADLHCIVGDMRLSVAAGGESFFCIGAEADDPAEPGEVVYRDDAGVLCRRCNWREADRIKLTGETRNVVLLTEVLPPVTDAEMRAALGHLSALVAECCGGTQEMCVLDASSPSCLLMNPAPTAPAGARAA